ncbi:UDP-glucuronic acid decarboxylase family protein [Paracoccus ravus]|uniref:UDP-glucuronic acid decarboxylase family protein n=1 Tax=Paracoccus ravus TaxID=2447760 RepID=UPI00106EA633|nr:UDP-glucuronic acid decarboxylase family protein [Paracoccus ravus]
MIGVLVTGGVGFVGSFLCERLLEDGHRVICVDNLQTGSLRNIGHLLYNPRFEFRPSDVELPLSGIDNIQRIYNLACPASPAHYQADPVRTMRTNVLGAINVLELAARSGARVLQASTSEVYGDPEVHPQREDYRGCVSLSGPRACYDEGKRAAETLCHDYARQYGVDIRVARIFNTYGPRMAADDGRVVSNFIVQALRGEALTVYGDGSQTRSFCFVSDLVDGLVRLMEAPCYMARPCNLGNPQERTILELAERIITMTGSASRIERRPLPQDDPTRRRPDITLATRELGWAPVVDIVEGLGRTIAYFDERLRERRALSETLANLVRPEKVGIIGDADEFAALTAIRAQPPAARATNVVRLETRV